MLSCHFSAYIVVLLLSWVCFRRLHLYRMNYVPSVYLGFQKSSVFQVTMPDGKLFQMFITVSKEKKNVHYKYNLYCW